MVSSTLHLPTLRVGGGDRGPHDSDLPARKSRKDESWALPKAPVDVSSSSEDSPAEDDKDEDEDEDDDGEANLIKSSSRKHVRPSPWVLRQWSTARRLENEEENLSLPNDVDSPSADLRLATDLGLWNKISASGQIRQWGNQSSGPAFAPPKPDPFLSASFDEVKEAI